MSALKTAMAVIQLGQTVATHLEALSATVWKDMKRMRMMSAKVCMLYTRYNSVCHELLPAIFVCHFLPFVPFEIQYRTCTCKHANYVLYKNANYILWYVTAFFIYTLSYV